MRIDSSCRIGLAKSVGKYLRDAAKAADLLEYGKAANEHAGADPCMCKQEDP